MLKGCLGVEYLDMRAFLQQVVGYFDCRRLAGVVRVLLEGSSKEGHLLALEVEVE